MSVYFDYFPLCLNDIFIVLLAHFPFNGTVANLSDLRVSFCIIVLLTCNALEYGFQLSIKFLN